MTVQDGIDLIIAASIPIAIVGLIWNRTATQKGLSVRSIQLLSVAIGIPALILVALQKIVDGAVVGTLLGGIFGYLLSNISNYDRSGSD